MNDQIVCGLAALFLIFFSTALVSALFSDGTLEHFRWRGSGAALSRLSIFLIVPFFLYFTAKMSVLATGRQWPWTVPVWAFLLYFGVFLVCHLIDRLRRGKEKR